MRKIASLARRLRRCFSKAQLCAVLLVRFVSSRSEYAFSFKDVQLFLKEKFVTLPKAFVRSAEHNSLLVVTVGGHQIFWPAELPIDDLPWLYHEVFDAFENNPSSYAHPQLCYEGRRWIIDAGAAEGYFSIFALQQSEARVISIEPLAMMRPALVKSLGAYSCSARTTVVSKALSNCEGYVEFLIDQKHVCDSKLQPLTDNCESPSSLELVERVQVTTLDLVAEELDLGDGGMIKMDIEGFEMAALMGARELLRRYRPALAIAVYHDLENAKKCAEIIREANPAYEIEFRGYYGYFLPPRPYMLFAF